MDTICPRQEHEALLEVQRQHVAHWRDDGTCSYCGSMKEEDFFAAIESGCEVGPTDKNYKAYVTLPNPNAGKPRIGASATRKPAYGEWIEVTKDNLSELPDRADRHIGEWVQVIPDGETYRAKFYFQHMSEDGRRKLVDLINARTIKFGYPGHFYVMPFFVVVENRSRPDGQAN